MASLLASYSALLKRRPLMGNMLTSAVLFATGDVIAQQVIEKKGSDHDIPRTARIVIWGGGIFAPVVTVWFRFLQSLPIANKTLATATRVGLDQFVMAPSILTGFFTIMTLMEGKTLEDAKAKWKQSFVPTLQTNWMVWIPVQTVNMALVPPHMRLLFVNGVNIPWNAFLSLQANQGKSATTEVKEAVKQL